MKPPGIFQSKWLVIVMHILLWGLVFLLPFLGERPHNLTPVPLIEPVLSRLLWIVLFYFNAYFLVPRFFNRKKIAIYVLSLLALLVLFVFLEELSFHPVGLKEFHAFIPAGENGNPVFVGHVQRAPVFFTAFPFLFIIAISTAFRIVSDRLKEEKVQKERETVHLRSELTFLRSQINPHFIFNVLNSLVSLARKKSDMLEPSLIRLSGLLHYMLYVPEEKISLQNEIDYLKDYIDLQQLRFGDSVKITTVFSTDTTTAQQLLEPVLLIPFVENAFKHGTQVLDAPFIRIRLEQRNSSLTFEVENKFSDAEPVATEHSSGIGLSNVRRRLDLLYPGKYTLNITKRDNIHLAQLLVSLT